MESIRSLVQNQINTTISKSQEYQTYLCHRCGSSLGKNASYYDRYCSECDEKIRSETNEKKRIDYVTRMQKFPDKYMKIIKDQSSEFRSCFITGQTGTGKTVLACNLAKAYCLRSYDSFSRFYSSPHLVVSLQSSFKSDDSIEDKVLEVAKFSGLIVLDDLGAEKLTDFVRQCFYLIVNEREQNELPIVITSNYSLNKISEQIDDRIASRILGMCEVIELSGSDRRIKKG